jgi:hypothetical protein
MQSDFARQGSTGGGSVSGGADKNPPPPNEFRGCLRVHFVKFVGNLLQKQQKWVKL